MARYGAAGEEALANLITEVIIDSTVQCSGCWLASHSLASLEYISGFNYKRSKEKMTSCFVVISTEQIYLCALQFLSV